MWEDVQEAITEVFIKKEHHIISALKSYPSQDNFFEMMRFDLVVDEDLKVYLLEANMSPNLSSAHYPPNQLLYEQVLYNLFSLVGLATYVNVDDPGTKNMLSSQKNIAVYSEECSTICKDSCEVSRICGLCRHCLSPSLRNSLLVAYRENLGKGDFRRLFPPDMKPNQDIGMKLKNITQINGLQYLWYQGKCNTDITWCM